MNAGRAIGRVGALAVALGVGMGISSAFTIAAAEAGEHSSALSEATGASGRGGGSVAVRGSVRVPRLAPISGDRAAGAGIPSRGSYGAQPTAARPAAVNVAIVQPGSAMVALRNPDLASGIVVPERTFALELDSAVPTASEGGFAATAPGSGASAIVELPIPVTAGPVDSAAETVAGLVVEVHLAPAAGAATASSGVVEAAVGGVPVLTAASDSLESVVLRTDPVAPAAVPYAPLLLTVLGWARNEFGIGEASRAVSSAAFVSSRSLRADRLAAVAVSDSKATSTAETLPAESVAPPADVAATSEAVGGIAHPGASVMPGLAISASAVQGNAVGGIFQPIFDLISGFFAAISNVLAQLFGRPAVPVNQAPTATAAVGAPDPSSGAVKVTIAASDADGDPLVYNVTTGPAKGTVSAISNGVLTYSPTTSARQTAAGANATVADKQDAFTVTITDGKGGSTSVAVSVTVLAAAAPIVKPLPQTYTTFGGDKLNLFMYRGTKIAILANSDSLDSIAMSKWLNAMDGAYSFYELATGREPMPYANVTYIDGRSIIARVETTCGAGCAYLGWTGVEMLNTNFDDLYRRLLTDNQYDQVPFYELGRNFWFYSDKLEYKSNDPVVTGYAVFMRFAAIDYLGLDGAPFNGILPYADFENQVRSLRTQYLADRSLNWNNTLGIGQGVPQSNWGATDLFASFCFYLADSYGTQWVLEVWKEAGKRPDATTTQDAVDNFVVAASLAANSNLAPLFDYWRWPVSPDAVAEIKALNLGSTWDGESIKSV